MVHSHVEATDAICGASDLGHHVWLQVFSRHTPLKLGHTASGRKFLGVRSILQEELNVMLNVRSATRDDRHRYKVSSKIVYPLTTGGYVWRQIPLNCCGFRNNFPAFLYWKAIILKTYNTKRWYVMRGEYFRSESFFFFLWGICVS